MGSFMHDILLKIEAKLMEIYQQWRRKAQKRSISVHQHQSWPHRLYQNPHRYQIHPFE